MKPGSRPSPIETCCWRPSASRSCICRGRDSRISLSAGPRGSCCLQSGRTALWVWWWETPYFLPLGPSQDLLLRTGYATREGLLLGGAWRRAGISSDYRVEASATRGSRTRPDGTRARELRGHLSAKGAIGLAKGWSVGWDATRASDASYLARYGLGRGINVLSQVRVPAQAR